MTTLLTALVCALAAAAAPSPAAAAPAPKVVRIDPPERGFYAKQVDYRGIPIKAAEIVSDDALLAAWRWLDRILGRQENIALNLRDAGAGLHIIGKDQVTSDLPENRRFKGKPWDGKLTIDQRTRGIGGRVASCGEENLLGLPGDRYKDRNICVHEFCHTIFIYGLSQDVRDRIAAQFRASLAKGLWKNAYASTNVDEFLAELAMWYVGARGDLGMPPPKPAMGPDGLRAYDPEAFALLDDLFTGRLKVARNRQADPAPLAARPADQAPTLKSADGPATTVRFRNQTPREVLLFWIDPKGERRPYGSIEPGEVHDQSTFAGHVWLAADPTGRPLCLFVAAPAAGLANIQDPPSAK